jgi:hypothetical protein
MFEETVAVQTFEVMFDPSEEVAVMDAEPAFTPVTTPAELTEATFESVECQVKVLLVALVGVTVAVRAIVPPIVTEAVAGIAIPVTATEAGGVLGEVESPPPPHARLNARISARPKPYAKAENRCVGKR